MAEVLVFHHALGLTPGVVAFADEPPRRRGTSSTRPTSTTGHTYTELSEGLEYAEGVGFGSIMERGRAAADALPAELVYLGFSLGVLPAQMLAQTRPGARGAVLLHACIPPEEFGPWPEGVRLQIHMMESDDIVQQEGDLDAARGTAELAARCGSVHPARSSSYIRATSISSSTAARSTMTPPQPGSFRTACSRSSPQASAASREDASARQAGATTRILLRLRPHPPGVVGR